MTSRVLNFKKSIVALGPADDTVTFEKPISLAFRGRRRIRLLNATISSYIPNVFTLPDFTNALIKVSNDGGTTWYDITLPNGIYTVHYLESAINKALASWWKVSSDPGFLLGANTVTDYVYLIIDSTKLNSGQLAIDFGASHIWELLGFKTTKMFDIDGTYSGSELPRVDWFGNAVSILLDGIGPLCDENGKDSFELCSIPLSVSVVTNEYVFPSGGLVSPWIDCEIPSFWASYRIRFVGSRKNDDGSHRQIVFTQGDVNIRFQAQFME